MPLYTPAVAIIPPFVVESHCPDVRFSRPQSQILQDRDVFVVVAVVVCLLMKKIRAHERAGPLPTKQRSPWQVSAMHVGSVQNNKSLQRT